MCDLTHKPTRTTGKVKRAKAQRESIDPRKTEHLRLLNVKLAPLWLSERNAALIESCEYENPDYAAVTIIEMASDDAARQ